MMSPRQPPARSLPNTLCEAYKLRFGGSQCLCELLMDQPCKSKPGFFNLPYDIRRLIYERIFSGRAYATLKTTDANGRPSNFLWSSQVLDEQSCLYVPTMPPIPTPDMRLLRTSKAFYAEAGAVAKQLWFKVFQDNVNLPELGALSTLARTAPVDSFGRVAKARLLKEASLSFTSEHMREWSTYVEIVPPKSYARERMVHMERSLLTFRTGSRIQAWAAESIDELDYLFYQGVLRDVRVPPAAASLDIAPLDCFGGANTTGQWLVQDVWHASDPEQMVVERRLRALIEWEGET